MAKQATLQVGWRCASAEMFRRLQRIEAFDQDANNGCGFDVVVPPLPYGRVMTSSR